MHIPLLPVFKGQTEVGLKSHSMRMLILAHLPA